MKDLTVIFYGHEHTHIIVRRKNKKGGYSATHYKGNFDIIKIEEPIAEFSDGPHRPGNWTYPFAIQLPDWLPASFN